MFTQFQGETRRDAIVNHYGFDMVEEDDFFAYLKACGESENSSDETIDLCHLEWRNP